MTHQCHPVSRTEISCLVSAQLLLVPTSRIKLLAFAMNAACQDSDVLKGELASLHHMLTLSRVTTYIYVYIYIYILTSRRCI
jgi:hypothetical protein